SKEVKKIEVLDSGVRGSVCNVSCRVASAGKLECHLLHELRVGNCGDRAGDFLSFALEFTAELRHQGCGAFLVHLPKRLAGACFNQPGYRPNTRSDAEGDEQ